MVTTCVTQFEWPLRTPTSLRTSPDAMFVEDANRCSLKDKNESDYIYEKQYKHVVHVNNFLKMVKKTEGRVRKEYG